MDFFNKILASIKSRRKNRASYKKLRPPFFWASLTIWSASVVLPDASFPNISTILPCRDTLISNSRSRTKITYDKHQVQYNYKFIIYFHGSNFSRKCCYSTHYADQRKTDIKTWAIMMAAFLAKTSSQEEILGKR